MTKAIGSGVATAPEEDQEMGLLEHLSELRTRILRSLIPVLPFTVLGWVVRWEIYEFLIAPLDKAMRALGKEGAALHTLGPTDAFMMHVKNSLMFGVLLSAPWIFLQIWSFISPGLYKREKKMALPFVLASTFCFVGGAFFGYTLVFDQAFRLLLEFNGESLIAQIVVSEYMPFFRRMLLAFGVVFEVPVVVTALSAAGIVTARQLVAFSRWWIVVAAFLSMILTPQDIYSMLMMLVPLIVLYYVGVAMAFLLEFVRKKAALKTGAK